jgi:hypothetical protein
MGERPLQSPHYPSFLQEGSLTLTLRDFFGTWTSKPVRLPVTIPGPFNSRFFRGHKFITRTHRETPRQTSCRTNRMRERLPRVLTTPHSFKKGVIGARFNLTKREFLETCTPKPVTLPVTIPGPFFSRSFLGHTIYVRPS